MIRRMISRLRRARDWKREHREQQRNFPTARQWELYAINCAYRDRMGAHDMPNIISCAEYQELLAYRSTGLSPEGIKRRLTSEPSSAPMKSPHQQNTTARGASQDARL